MTNVGLFCSSANELPQDFQRLAANVGQWLGARGGRLVYGGVNRGLMEIAARAVKSHGGEVMGVVPLSMMQEGLVSSFVDRCVMVADLAERKAVLLREAEVFVALPGGIGTFDELFSVLAAYQVGEHVKPLFLLDVANFWSPFVRMLSAYERQGVVAPAWRKALRVVTSVNEIDQYLSETA